VTNPQLQTQALLYATAHLAQLFAPRADGSAPSPIVGRINSAIRFCLGGGGHAGDARLLSLVEPDPFGAFYWVMTAPFRTMRYVPAAIVPTEPWPVFGTGFIAPVFAGWTGPGTLT